MAHVAVGPLRRASEPASTPDQVRGRLSPEHAPTEAVMGDFAEHMHAVDSTIAHAIRAVGSAIEIFGVLIIVCGIAFATYRMLRARDAEEHERSQETKIRIGRSLLLGLEVLVAADIVKTIAIELTFTSLGLLAGLVLVRTFLSWTLALEIEGRWPWQRSRSGTG
jgi:uncharacterized membrane protein